MVSQRWRKGDVIREISYSWLLNEQLITTGQVATGLLLDRMPVGIME